MDKNNFLEIGKIVNTHALRGAVKVVVWADSTDVIADFKRLYDENGNTYNIKSVSYQKDNAIVKFAGIDSIEEAEKIKGTVLLVSRDDFKLPEGTYFIADLIGLSVYENDKYYGKIDDVFSAGGCDVYSIKDGKNEILFPALKENILNVDLENKKIIIKFPEGLFDL